MPSHAPLAKLRQCRCGHCRILAQWHYRPHHLNKLHLVGQLCAFRLRLSSLLGSYVGCPFRGVRAAFGHLFVLDIPRLWS